MSRLDDIQDINDTSTSCDITFQAIWYRVALNFVNIDSKEECKFKIEEQYVQYSFKKSLNNSICNITNKKFHSYQFTH